MKKLDPIADVERLALIAGRFLHRAPGGFITKHELANLLVSVWPIVEAARQHHHNNHPGGLPLAPIHCKVCEAVRAFAHPETETERTEREHGS